MTHGGRNIGFVSAGILFLSFLFSHFALITAPEAGSIPGGQKTANRLVYKGFPASDENGRKKEASCGVCHPRDDERLTLPAESPGAGLPGEDPRDTGKWAVRFAHESHESLSCLTCHKAGSEAPAGPVEADACFECHGESIKAGRCRDCHGKDRFFPSHHKPSGKWTKRHGYRANVMVFPDRRSWNRVTTGHAYDCGACHRDDQCRKCHQLNRPDSHNGFWRIRAHGITALAQRESCAFCHVETFCVRCHKNTRPINHVGNWNMLHGKAVAQGHAERCWVCHPRRITRIRVGNTPECLLCHPR